MAITAKEVNELRKMTGAGMMDCKKALTEANGDYDKAIDILRTKGQKVSDSRADRDVKEGVVFIKTNDDATESVLVALACETDFVAKNDEFQTVGNKIAEIAFEENPATIEELNGLSYDNLRTYLVSVGNVFSKIGSEMSYEPSVMFMYRDATKESLMDINIKAYREMDFGKLWAGLSYRRSFDGAEFLNGTGVSSQKLQYFTPLVGVNYKDFVFAYTYSYQANSVVFNNGGFHQLTLGLNFNCVREKYECNCPSVN